jgi:hypothetical protein
MTDQEERNRKFDESHQRAERRHQEHLERARADALRSGKEPFDLEKVKRLWVLQRPTEERPGPGELEMLEFEYYTNPFVRTNEEFAKRLSDNEFWR